MRLEKGSCMRHHRHHGLDRRRGRGGVDEGFERGPGGRRRRLFDSAELRLLLLALINEQPRHGYDLIREVEARTGGAYAPSPGMVYPMTTLLLDMGLLEETGGDSQRKLFAITDAGRADLATHEAAVQAAFAKLQSLAEVRERTDAAPVARAMQNLKTAVHNRLSQEGVDKAVILEVAALIDQAASNVERL
jgi:DNA-binding PadR family transcriptional regulator